MKQTIIILALLFINFMTSAQVPTEKELEFSETKTAHASWGLRTPEGKIIYFTSERARNYAREHYYELTGESSEEVVTQTETVTAKAPVDPRYEQLLNDKVKISANDVKNSNTSVVNNKIITADNGWQLTKDVVYNGPDVVQEVKSWLGLGNNTRNRGNGNGNGGWNHNNWGNNGSSCGNNNGGYNNNGGCDYNNNGGGNNGSSNDGTVYYNGQYYVVYDNQNGLGPYITLDGTHPLYLSETNIRYNGVGNDRHVGDWVNRNNNGGGNNGGKPRLNRRQSSYSQNSSNYNNSGRFRSNGNNSNNGGYTSSGGRDYGTH